MKKYKKKAAYGLDNKRPSIRHYIESPDQAIAENNISMVKAEMESMNNPWTQGLDIVGGMALSKGLGMLGGATPNQVGQSFKSTFGRKAEGGATVGKLSAKEIQEALIEKGYDVGSSGADGILGRKTGEAVKSFQKDSGLSTDGIVGKKTTAALVDSESQNIADPYENFPDLDPNNLRQQTQVDRNISRPIIPEDRIVPNAKSNTDEYKSIKDKKDLQRNLRDANLYDGPIDGLIGPKTKKALEEFENKHGNYKDNINKLSKRGGIKNEKAKSVLPERFGELSEKELKKIEDREIPKINEVKNNVPLYVRQFIDDTMPDMSINGIAKFTNNLVTGLVKDGRVKIWGGDSEVNEKHLSNDEYKFLTSVALNQLKKGKNTIDYDDYRENGAENKSAIDTGGIDLSSEGSVLKTLGQASIHVEEDGTIIIKDQFNWNDAGGEDKRYKGKDHNEKGLLDISGPKNWGSFNDILSAGNNAIYRGARNFKTLTGRGDDEGGAPVNITLPVNANERMAHGGSVGGEQIEVEGEEVAKLPDGENIKFKGPSHEQGGIDIMLPNETEVFSKRIKIDGVTMADRQGKRKKRTVTLEELMKSDGTDAFLKSAHDRTTTTNAVEEEFDVRVQEKVRSLLPDQNNMANYGDTISYEDKMKDYESYMAGQNNLGTTLSYEDKMKDYESYMGQQNNLGTTLSYEDKMKDYESYMAGQNKNKPLKNLLGKVGGAISKGGKNLSNHLKDKPIGSSFTMGDAIGMAGQFQQAFGPKKITMKERADDTANVNMYEDYGQEQLDLIDRQKLTLSSMKDRKQREIESARRGLQERNRSGARGINQLRSLDLAGEQQMAKSELDIMDQYDRSLMDILSREGALNTDIDSKVMAGEQARDEADRKDQAHYYSNLQRDMRSQATGLQQIGKSFNTMKGSNRAMDILDQMELDGVSSNTLNTLASILAKAEEEVKNKPGTVGTGEVEQNGK